MHQHFQLIAASTGARIVQHGASMAAYNTTMTLLHATQLEGTDFAKPVIFHEGLIVLVQLLRVLRFCLLTNDPQQSTRTVCHHKIGMCLLLLRPLHFFLFQNVSQQLQSSSARLLRRSNSIECAAFLLTRFEFLTVALHIA